MVVSRNWSNKTGRSYGIEPSKMLKTGSLSIKTVNLTNELDM